MVPAAQRDVEQPTGHRHVSRSGQQVFVDQDLVAARRLVEEAEDHVEAAVLRIAAVVPQHALEVDQVRIRMVRRHQ